MNVEPAVGVVFLNSGALEGGGGAERRFARVIRFFHDEGKLKNLFLITTRDMLRALEKASLEIASERLVLIDNISPPSGDGNILRRAIAHFGNSFRFRRLFREIIERYGINVIHFVSKNRYSLPFLFLRNGEVRVVTSTVARTQLRMEFSLMDRLFWKCFFTGVDAIDALYEEFVEVHPEYHSKVRITPCSFTDYTLFKGAAEKERWIVFAGRLDPQKNPMLFLHAAFLLSSRARERDWKFFLLGKGELEGKLKAFVAGKGMEDIVSIGAHSDISSLLNKAAIFTSLQQLENYPSQSLLEAMAAEAAVIATDVGHTRRLIDGANGILLKEQTASALSEELLSLMDNEALRRTLGERARKSVMEKHRIETFALYLERLWTEPRTGVFPGTSSPKTTTG